MALSEEVETTGSMGKLRKWKADIIVWLLAKFNLGHFTILHGEEEDGHHGCVLWTDDDMEHLEAILHSSLENCSDVRGMVFGAVLKYLRRYEVDCKHFLEELNK